MLREQGIKIGSTTGYTAKMMEIVRPGAEAKGYRVDKSGDTERGPGRPSCIRAPPEAVKRTTGNFSFVANSNKRVIFSPTTEPLKP